MRLLENTAFPVARKLPSRRSPFTTENQTVLMFFGRGLGVVEELHLISPSF